MEVSNDTKHDLIIVTTNILVVDTDCVELTQDSLHKKGKLQGQLIKYYEDLHLQNEFIEVKCEYKVKKVKLIPINAE
jgi:hypothetical protein